MTAKQDLETQLLLLVVILALLLLTLHFVGSIDKPTKYRAECIITTTNPDICVQEPQCSCDLRTTKGKPQ